MYALHSFFICIYKLTSPARWIWWISSKHILDKRSWNRELECGLVNKSASWRWEETAIGVRRLERNLSCTTWQSMSICLVCSWKTTFLVMWIVARLSQSSRMGRESGREKKILGKLNKPCEVTSSETEGAILSFCRRNRDNLLLLAAPWH